MSSAHHTLPGRLLHLLAELDTHLLLTAWTMAHRWTSNRL